MRRPALTLATLAAFAILIGLGLWQLARGEEKAALLADLAARAEAAPMSLTEVLARAEAGMDARYSRIAARGRFGAVAVYLVATRNGRAGWREFRLFTPDPAPNPGAPAPRPVLLDRGFHPVERLDPSDARDPGAARVQIVALVAPAPKPGLFTPPADPAAGIFYVRDVPGMTAALGGDPTRAAPFTLAVITETVLEGAEADAPAPTPAPPRIEDISNRHLEYALTWFGLGAALLGVYGAMRVGERRGRPAPPA